jgi:N-carbamoyl-L-amino-acid hydrolase
MKYFLLLPALVFACLGTSLAQNAQINSERLQKSLSTLATYGKNEKGGSDRIAYSIHDIAARPFIKQLLVDAGLEVSVDHAGNIIGRKA